MKLARKLNIKPYQSLSVLVNKLFRRAGPARQDNVSHSVTCDLQATKVKV
jgi:hypothetical protein